MATTAALSPAPPSRSTGVPFPDVLPPGYDWFDDEPTFDPATHLQLEAPGEIVMLTELGYDESELGAVATPVALSSPFRVLSDEGAAVMLDIARRLEAFTKPAADRIERMTRGGCYRSRWLRDLCISPDVNNHLATIYGIDIAPHAMPLHLGHLNYSPKKQATAAIDKWHHDTLPLDYVLMVTDPTQVPGGRFEYFVGTKAEAAALAADGLTPPPDRCIAPDFPGPGYAVALHGNMVVHRAAPSTTSPSASRWSTAMWPSTPAATTRAARSISSPSTTPTRSGPSGPATPPGVRPGVCNPSSTSWRSPTMSPRSPPPSNRPSTTCNGAIAEMRGDASDTVSHYGG